MYIVFGILAYIFAVLAISITSYNYGVIAGLLMASLILFARLRIENKKSK